MARSTARRRRRYATTGVAVLALVSVAGAAIWALSSSGGPTYRLATAGYSTVSQAVDSTGVVSSVNQATVTFPVSGTVASVRVKLGQIVSPGQILATLDTSTLDQQVQSQAAAVASAQQALLRDEASQSSSSSSAAVVTTNAASVRPLTPTPAFTPTPRPTGSGGGGGGPGSLAGAVAAVKKAQQAVIADQHAADIDADVVAADQAVVAETAVCQAILSATAPPTATATPTATPTGTATDLAACQHAIAAVQAAQGTVQHDEDTLAHDEAALNQAVGALVTAVGKIPSSGSGGSTSTPTGSRTSHATGGTGTGGTGTTGGGTNTSNSSRASTSTVITAEQLAADQKQIDSARAQLTLAQQDRAAAVLTAPIAGTVGASSIIAGQPASAGSSSIQIVGPGSKSITTTVGIADIDLIERGQAAAVTVDGVSTPLSGKVSYIGVMNTSGTSGTTTTYPVTVVLDPTATPLFDGAGASVSINVGTVPNALTVPLSAVHRLGTLSTVTVYAGGKLSIARVTLGVVGSALAQVTSGLTAGQQVVLANVSEPVPTTNLNGRFGGGLGGAGGLGGGAVRRVTGG